MTLKGTKLEKICCVLCVIIIIISVLLCSGCSEKKKASDTFQSYKKSWEKQDFAEMYKLLSSKSKGKISEEDFVSRYQNIYRGIEASDIKIKNEKNDKNKISFSIEMNTVAGKVVVPGFIMELSRAKSGGKWNVDWNEKLIFPDLEGGDKVKVAINYPKRGEIRDRNDKELAINGSINTIGIVPGKFNAVKDKAMPEMAQILDISQDRIENKLKASTNSDWFVPIVKLSAEDKEKATKLTAIDGVQYQKSDGRIYPLGEAAGSLIGYIGPITEEELNKHKGEGYSAQDNIGKMGLEQVYEKRLRGEKGGEIYVIKENGSKKTIAKKDAKDGENIKISIDTNLQKNIYDSMKGDGGASTAINPKTGEILALVSSPSINPNLFSTYIPDTIKKNWDSAAKSPYTNRFKGVYAPGSTFKLVTGAIGLNTGAIKPDEGISITGKEWHNVTRVSDTGKPVNLRDAYIFSDNIYFAKAALKIGKDNLAEGAKKFGIGEEIPIDYPMGKSQLSNSGLSSEALIADTGYGQGEVLLSPLNLAMIYSSLANNGDIMVPILELKGAAPKMWKEKAILPEHVKTLTDDLTQVIENPSGTGYTATPSKTKLLGKTGTSELKKDKNDTNSEENGWFVAMNVENPNLVVAMIIEDVKTRGESHYVVPIVKKIFDDTLK